MFHCHKVTICHMSDFLIFGFSVVACDCKRAFKKHCKEPEVIADSGVLLMA